MPQAYETKYSFLDAPLWEDMEERDREPFIKTLNEIREFLLEKHIGDPEEVPGYIYDLPKVLVEPSASDYGKYMCRGTVANSLMMKLYWFKDSGVSPLEEQSREKITAYQNEIQNIYRKVPGKDLMRTEAELRIVRELINLIVVEIEEGLNIPSDQRVGKKPQANVAAA